MRTAYFRAALLIILGCVFLAHNFGLIPNLGTLMAHWWPLILIAVGVAMLLNRRPCRRNKEVGDV